MGSKINKCTHCEVSSELVVNNSCQHAHHAVQTCREDKVTVSEVGKTMESMKQERGKEGGREGGRERELKS